MAKTKREVSTFFSDKLYTMLPEVFRSRDSEEQLKQFMSVFAEELDMLKNDIDNFVDLVDLDRVPKEYIPVIAHFLGAKELGTDLSEKDQRVFLKNIVRAYKSKGTEPGIKHLARMVLGNVDLTIKKKYRNVLHTFTKGGTHNTTLLNVGTFRTPNDVTGYIYDYTAPSAFWGYIGLDSLDAEGIQYVFDRFLKFQRILPDFVPAETTFELIFLGFTSTDEFTHIIEHRDTIDVTFSAEIEDMPEVVEKELSITSVKDADKYDTFGGNREGRSGIILLNAGKLNVQYLYSSRTWHDEAEMSIVEREKLKKASEASEHSAVSMKANSFEKTFVLNSSKLNKDKLSLLDTYSAKLHETDLRAVQHVVEKDTMPTVHEVDSAHFETPVEVEKPVKKTIEAKESIGVQGFSSYYVKSFALNSTSLLNVTKLPYLDSYSLKVHDDEAHSSTRMKASDIVEKAKDTDALVEVSTRYVEEPCKKSKDADMGGGLSGTFRTFEPLGAMVLNASHTLNKGLLGKNEKEHLRKVAEGDATGLMTIYDRQIKFTGARLNNVTTLKLNNKLMRLQDNEQRVDTTIYTETRLVV